MFFEYRITAVSMETCVPTTLSEYMLSPFPFLRIASVSDGLTTWSVAGVVALVDAGLRFYVSDDWGHKQYVKVVRPALGAPYLRTEADGILRNNLLALPGGPLFSAPRTGILPSY